MTERELPERARRWWVLLITIALLVAAAPTASAGQHRDHGRDHDRSQLRQLIQVMRATARYHDVDRAIADGYELGYQGVVTGCIAHPTDGAMGFHYFNAELMEDPDTDRLRPEGLLYEPRRDGSLRLVAVEWVVPGEVWDATGEQDPPSVLGTDLHVLNPALGWWIHHAWVWKWNPSGVFADWNPRVDCPDGVAPPT